MDLRFCLKQLPTAQGFFKVTKTLTIVSYATKYLSAANLKFNYLLTNAIICRHGVLLELKLRQISFHNSTMIGCYSHFSKTVAYGATGLFSPKSPYRYKHGGMIERRYNTLTFLRFLFFLANTSFYISMIS